MEASTCPSEGQDRPELETLEAEAAPALKAATRAARPPTTCSTLEILFVMVATDFVSDKILFSNLVNPCTSMEIDASAPRCASNCESFLAKMPRISPSLNLWGEHPLSRGRAQNHEEHQSLKKCLVMVNLADLGALGVR